MDRLAEWAAELQSLAQAGLYYTRDIYDRERFQRVRDIAAEMMSERTGLSLENITELFCADSGYQTPKVDTRAAIIRDDRILLVQERSGSWTLPGGWCEFNLTPAENVIKETYEEAGLEVTVKKLIAVQDRDRHNRPPYLFHVVKIFFLCEERGGCFQENSETLASGFFRQRELPPLAEEITVAEQIHMCFEAAKDENWHAEYD